MTCRPKRGFHAALILCVLSALGGGAVAQAQVKQFNVPPQSATTGIPEFARQAGIQILVSEPLVHGKRTAEVTGAHSIEQALTILLAGTGLAATSIDGTTYTLAAAAPAPVPPRAPTHKPQDASSGGGTQGAPARGNESSTSDVLQEIVITASKRPEILSKAPMAVSAVNQSDLDRSGINDLTDVATQVPNLQLSGNGFSLRGLGSSNITDQSFSTVAVHIDGIYEQRPDILKLALYDIDRIEVLRGPQGTLYGRNATAGVVNIVTNDPQPTFGASGDVAYGNANEVTVRGALNVPVADTLALRLSYVSQNNDGFGDAAAPDGRKYDVADNRTVRLTGLWKPADAFWWRLVLSHSSNQGTNPYDYPAYYSTFPGANFAAGTEGRPSAPIAIAGTPYTFPAYNINGMDEQDDAVRSAMRYRFSDDWHASYVAGWSEFDNDSVLPTTPTFFFLQHNRATAVSHEIDLSYDTQRLHGIFGGYYYHEKLDDSALIHEYDVAPAPWNELLGGTGALPLIIPSVDLLSHSPNRYSESSAVFGQLTFDVIDAFRLTGGLRYSSDREGNDHQFITVCGAGTATTLQFAQTCGLPQTRVDIGGLYTSSSNTSWKATAEYDLTSDMMLYATVSTGYRAGGVADKLTPVAAQTFRPEHLTNYELGLRTQWLDHRLSVNVTVFDMDYKDLQVTTLLQESGLSPSPVTFNAARAMDRGLELETAWKATSADTLSGYLSVLHAKFDSFPNGTDGYLSVSGSVNTVLTATGFPTLSLQPYDFSGHDLPNAPRFSARFNYAHAFHVPEEATLSPIVSIYCQSSAFLDASNEPATEQYRYAAVDGTLRFDPESKSYFVEGYAYNLTNRRILQTQTEAWGLISSTYGLPRRYGVRAGFKF